MTRTEFIHEFASNVLEVSPDGLEPDTELAQFEMWDSTGALSLLILLDEQGVAVSEEQLINCKTLQDVLDLAGDVLTG